MKAAIIAGCVVLSVLGVPRAHADTKELVICLRSDGLEAWCKPNGVFVADKPTRVPTAVGHKTILLDESGGELPAHIERFRELAKSRDEVEIRGSCPSGCTMIVAYVPADRICFGEWANLQFHMAAYVRESGKVPAPIVTREMFDRYPQNIRTWLLDQGGVEKMTIETMWILPAHELWAMGYRKCGPGPLPTMKNRPNDRNCHDR